jgi:lipoprotein-anchoring transpeptidase ErfK/SrfK
VRRAGSILCLTLVCALGAGVATARADDPPAAAATIAEGVSIGPVAVGGMTPEDATRAVIAAYLRPVVLRMAGRRVTVSPRRFRIKAPVAAAVQKALLGVGPGSAVSLRATVDTERLEAYVASLAKRYDRTPTSSELLMRGSRPVLTKGRPGRAVRMLPTRMLIRNELREGVRKPISVPIRVLKPRPGSTAGAPIVVIRRDVNRLTLYDGARLVRTFKVATGQAAYPTPLGQFQIVVKWTNPTWYPPTYDSWAKGLKPVPPGPNNPLGTRWMGLSSPGVGIHGTDDPASIGYSVSHGCIRMQVPDAEWLFDHVTIGTKVFIVRS